MSNTTEERVRKLISEQAADWFVANRAGLRADERDAFAAWLKGSPLHVEEYLALSVMARDLPTACAASADSIDTIVARARAEQDIRTQPLRARIAAALGELRSARLQTAVVAMAALAVVCISLLLMRNLTPVARVATPAAPTALRFETRHGEQQSYRLADNSLLRLNTDSAVTVRYSHAERLVVLTSGEADFEVTHETQRPFRVLAGLAEIVDLGTQFDVRLQQDATMVTVVEGQVAVARSASRAGPDTDSNQNQSRQFVPLRANQQIDVTASEWPAIPVTLDAQQATSWLHQQIKFEHEPLERVAAEFNRYAPKPIEITTPALRNLEISGVFATDDSEAFVAFLRSLDGVRVEVTATRIRVSKN
jgi:transmembrane sensor